MNRTQRPAELAKQQMPGLDFEMGLAHAAASSRDTSHTLFAPLHYEPGYSYPLIVWLHGPGNDERQLVRVMPLISMRNYIAIAPRGIEAPADAPPRSTGPSGLTWCQSEDHIQLAQQRIFECINIARQKFNVASHRVFLAGFDLGGTMAFRVAMDRPERFAGVLSLGGAFPKGRTPFRNLTAIRRLPIFLAVGRDSDIYSPDAACEDLRLFHSAGMSITLRQYPFGHELAPQLLGDVDRWIMDQIASASRPDTAAGSSSCSQTS
jgi:phospholipase/carboxylesterase